MKRNIIAVICVILTVTFIFVGCSKTTYYIDGAGNKHIAYTDENGETVTDGYGNVIIVSTDSAGNTLTDKFGDLVTLPADNTEIHVDRNGKRVESSVYTLLVPDGWVLYSGIEDYAQLRYGDEESDVSVDIQFSRDSYDDMAKLMKSYHKQFVEAVDEVVINTEEETELRDGEIKPVTKLTFLGSRTVDGNKNTVGYIIYVFNKGMYTFNITCGVHSEDDLKNIDFDTVLDAITFKQ